MTREILIYGGIGSSPGEISAKDIADQLTQAKGFDVLLRVNSPGGEVSEALAIIAQVQSYRGKVVARVDGIAASAAGLIVAAAPVAEASPDAMLMIHGPRTYADGDAADLRASADTLDVFAAKLREIYGRRWKAAPEKLEAALSAGELWLTAQEALAVGIVDRVLEPAMPKPRSSLAAPILAVAALADTRRQLEAATGELNALRAQAAHTRLERIRATVTERVPAAAFAAVEALVAFCAAQSDDGKSFLESIPHPLPGAAPLGHYATATLHDATPASLLAEYKARLANLRS
jgi:ATP-dependent protease ClpP protease subunit